MERNIARPGTMDPGKKYLKHALESILSGIRYGVKKKYGIIWEFFPNGGRLRSSLPFCHDQLVHFTDDLNLTIS